MKHDFLTDELDSTAVRLVYEKWKGNATDPPQFKLGLDNLMSYGLHLAPNAIFSRAVGTPAPVEHSEEETEEAFQTVMAPQATGEGRKGVEGAFLTFILPIVAKFLLGFLLK